MDKASDRTLILPGGLDAATVSPDGPPSVPDGPSQASADIREAVDTSKRGAPSVGEAVTDIFSTDEIFHRLMATADEEFARSPRLLFLSGLAAGLSIGLTFLARAAMTGLVGDADPTGLVGNLLYPVGFLFIVLGRYQLYTENTLTPVTLVLTRLASLPRLLKIWGIVFAANVLGAAGAAFLFARTEVLEPAAAEAAYHFGEHALSMPWSTLFFKGMVAGWMVAGMVWLMHAVRDGTARFFLIYFIMFMVPSFDLFHCVIGACELFYYVFEGGVALHTGLLAFLLPVVLGNTVGGVLFVALPNYFQTRGERYREWVRLSWRDWLWGHPRTAAPAGSVMTPKKTLVAVFAGAVLLAACDPPPASPVAAPDTMQEEPAPAGDSTRSTIPDRRALFAESRARWAASGVEHYRFTFRREVLGSVESLGATRIVVRDGLIREAHAEGGGRLFSTVDPQRKNLLPVDSLFAVLHTALDTADSLAIRYDAALGFPYYAYVRIPTSERTARETIYEVRDFVRLAPTPGSEAAPGDTATGARP